MRVWMGKLRTLQGVIWLYTNEKMDTYWAYYYDNNNNLISKVKTKSWKRFIRILQRDLKAKGIIDSDKALWVDRFLWNNRPLHEYILNY